MSAESVWRCVVIGAIIGALVTRGAVEMLTGNRMHPAVISFVVLPVLAVLLWLGWDLCRGVWALTRPPEKRLRRIRLFESDYGRGAGWVAERDGRPIAVLCNPSRAEMFWHWYDVEVTTSEAAERHALSHSQEAWSGLRYRSRLTGELCPYGWAVGPPGEDGRLLTRGLYIPLGDPSLIEAIVLWWRKRQTGPGSTGA